MQLINLSEYLVKIEIFRIKIVPNTKQTNLNHEKLFVFKILLLLLAKGIYLEKKTYLGFFKIKILSSYLSN